MKSNYEPLEAIDEDVETAVACTSETVNVGETMPCDHKKRVRFLLGVFIGTVGSILSLGIIRGSVHHNFMIQRLHPYGHYHTPPFGSSQNVLTMEDERSDGDIMMVSHFSKKHETYHYDPNVKKKLDKMIRKNSVGKKKPHQDEKQMTPGVVDYKKKKVEDWKDTIENYSLPDPRRKLLENNKVWQNSQSGIRKLHKDEKALSKNKKDISPLPGRVINVNDKKKVPHNAYKKKNLYRNDKQIKPHKVEYKKETEALMKDKTAIPSLPGMKMMDQKMIHYGPQYPKVEVWKDEKDSSSLSGLDRKMNGNKKAFHGVEVVEKKKGNLDKKKMKADLVDYKKKKAVHNPPLMDKKKDMKVLQDKKKVSYNVQVKNLKYVGDKKTKETKNKKTGRKIFLKI